MNEIKSRVRFECSKVVKHTGEIDSKIDEMTEELEALGYDVSLEEVEDE